VKVAADARTQRHLDEIGALLESRIKSPEDVTHDYLGRLMWDMAHSQSVVFNAKTHKRETRLSQRFPYVYYAAELVEDKARTAMLEEVLAHLREAQTVSHTFWGESEFQRLSTVTVAELDADTQAGLRRELGDEFDAIQTLTLGSITGDLRQRLVEGLGRHLATGLHRQLMVMVSGQLWVDYLTEIEGLRTSISLESYAQRDPLISYKSKAFELFQQLLVNMRAVVVGRLYTYRPRTLNEVRAEVERTVNVAATKPVAGKAGGARPAQGGAALAPKASAPVALAAPKRDLGRNDPCWCGSGKKYKNCHMASDGKK
jgi:preprotein translocase subunit SecA